MFLTKGMGRHPVQLASFELALRDAGIASFNLVSVSSIFPSGCAMVSRKKGISMLEDGEIVHCVLAKCETDEAQRVAVSSVGVAIPADKDRYGYLSEYHCFGQNAGYAGEYTEDLAASMLGSVLGLDLDLEKAWDKRRKEWKIAGRAYRTTNVTQTAMGKHDFWTTVVAAAVFCG
jgi:arginine decarboxylase